MYQRRDITGISTSPPSEFSPFLSCNDAKTLLEFIHGSLSCDTEKDYKGLYQKLQKLFPFDFAHGMLGRHDKDNGVIRVHCAPW